MKGFLFLLLSTVAFAIPFETTRDFVIDAISKSIANGTLIVPQDPAVISTLANDIASNNVTLGGDLTVHGNFSAGFGVKGQKDKVVLKHNYMCWFRDFKGPACRYNFIAEQNKKTVLPFISLRPPREPPSSVCGSIRTDDITVKTRLITYQPNGGRPAISDVIGAKGWRSVPEPWGDNTHAYISWGW